jgi:hypothetical protein
MNRHFLLTNGRSGSNYFVQLLNQHPNLVNYGEVLGPWTLPGRTIRPLFRGRHADYLDWLFESPVAFAAGQAVSFLSRIRRNRPPHVRRRGAIVSVGVKEFTVNLDRYGLRAYLAERSDIRLVTLVRANPLARLVSARALAASGRVARVAGDAGPPPAAVALNPASIVHDLDVIELENEAVRAAGLNHRGPVFRIEYEAYFGADAARQAAIADALQAFLGAEPRPLAAEHRKLRSAPLAAAVANYADIRRALAGGPYERWLDDDL